MLYRVMVGDRTFEIELGAEGVTVDGQLVDVDLAHVEATPVHNLLLDNTSHRLVAWRDGAGDWDVHLHGRRFRAEVVDERTRAIQEMTGAGAGPSGPKPIVAPMPGLIVKVEVAEGETVRPGQGIVIVEAMKMENELRAEAAGVVSRIHVTEGETVEKDQVLVDLVEIEEDADGS